MNIHTYTHIIIKIIDVRLPYVLENPSNRLIYIEKNHDTIYHEIDEKIAPIIWDFIGNLCFGINLYINKKTTNIGITNKNPLIFKT